MSSKNPLFFSKDVANSLGNLQESWRVKASYDNNKKNNALSLMSSSICLCEGLTLNGPKVSAQTARSLSSGVPFVV